MSFGLKGCLAVLDVASSARCAGVDLLLSGMPCMSATEQVLQHLRREGGQTFDEKLMHPLETHVSRCVLFVLLG